MEHRSESAMSVDCDGNEDCLVVEEVTDDRVSRDGWCNCVVGASIEFFTFVVLKIGVCMGSKCLDTILDGSNVLFWGFW